MKKLKYLFLFIIILGLSMPFFVARAQSEDMPDCPDQGCQEAVSSYGSWAWLYDQDINGIISQEEVLEAAADYGEGLLTREQACGIINIWSEDCEISTCSDQGCTYLSSNFSNLLSTYDANQNQTINLDEILEATADYGEGELTKPQLCALKNFWEESCEYSVQQEQTGGTDLTISSPTKIASKRSKLTVSNAGRDTVSSFVTTVELGELMRCGGSLSKCGGTINYQEQCSFSTTDLAPAEEKSYACEYEYETEVNHTYAVRIKVDAYNEIEESNEDNNEKVETFQLEEGTSVSISPGEVTVNQSGEEKEFEVGTGTPKTTVRQEKGSVNIEEKGEEVSFESSPTKEVTIRPGREKTTIESGGVKAETELNLGIENQQLRASTQQGKKEVKIKPDQARDQVKKDLGADVEDMTLESEAGQLSYRVEGNKKSRLLGLIPTTERISAQVDANTGKVNQVKRPWWSFMAF